MNASESGDLPGLVDLQRRVARLEAQHGAPLPALKALVALWLRCGQAIAALVTGVREAAAATDRRVWQQTMLYHEENFFLRVQRFPVAIDAAAEEHGAGADFTARATDGAPQLEAWHEAAQAVQQLENPVLRHIRAARSLEALRCINGVEPEVDAGYVSMVLDELLPVYEELHHMTTAMVEAAERMSTSAA